MHLIFFRWYICVCNGHFVGQGRSSGGPGEDLPWARGGFATCRCVHFSSVALNPNKPNFANSLLASCIIENHEKIEEKNNARVQNGSFACFSMCFSVPQGMCAPKHHHQGKSRALLSLEHIADSQFVVQSPKNSKNNQKIGPSTSFSSQNTLRLS